MGGGRKRTKKGSNSSTEEEHMGSSDSLQLLKDSIDCLKTAVSGGFEKIHEDMDKLRHDFKEEIGRAHV